MLQEGEQHGHDKALWCEKVWDIPKPHITHLHCRGQIAMVKVHLETPQETEVPFPTKSKEDCFPVLKDYSVSPFKQQVKELA